MKFKITTAEFKKAFNFVKAMAVPKDDNNHSCVQMDVNDDGVMLSCYNDQASANYFVEENVEISGEGTLLLDVKTVERVTSSASSESITFSFENGDVEVLVGKSKHKINPSTYPALPAEVINTDVDFITTLNTNPFIQSSKLSSVASSGSMYSLAGIRLDFAEDGDWVVTDGKMLASGKFSFSGKPEVEAVTVPVKAVAVLAKMGDCLRALIYADHAYFTNGKETINTKLVDGRFPAWRRIIKDEGTLVTPTRESLLESVTTMLVSDKNKVDYTFGLISSATSKNEKGSSTIDIELREAVSQDVSISFNADTIKLLLAVTDGDKINMKVNGGFAFVNSNGINFMIAGMES